MKRILISLLLVFSVVSISYAKKESTPGDIPEYVIEGCGSASGESLVKVSVMAKKAKDITEQQLAKAAVHGVLFRGYSNSTVQGYGESSDHPAVAGGPNAFNQYIDFFEPFFTGGDYMNYVRFLDDSRSVTKVGNMYRVSAKVRVATGQLKKDLSAKGINAIQTLGSGF
jgi:hypothetical protein